MFFSVLVKSKPSKCPSTDEWRKKILCVCIYIHIYSYKYICIFIYTHGIIAIKQNGIMPFAATWMGLEIFILSEVSQREKDKHDIT